MDKLLSYREIEFHGKKWQVPAGDLSMLDGEFHSSVSVFVGRQYREIEYREIEFHG